MRHKLQVWRFNETEFTSITVKTAICSIIDLDYNLFGLLWWMLTMQSPLNAKGRKSTKASLCVQSVWSWHGLLSVQRPCSVFCQASNWPSKTAEAASFNVSRGHSIVWICCTYCQDLTKSEKNCGAFQGSFHILAGLCFSSYVVPVCLLGGILCDRG